MSLDLPSAKECLTCILYMSLLLAKRNKHKSALSNWIFLKKNNFSKLIFQMNRIQFKVTQNIKTQDGLSKNQENLIYYQGKRSSTHDSSKMKQILELPYKGFKEIIIIMLFEVNMNTLEITGIREYFKSGKTRRQQKT